MAFAPGRVNLIGDHTDYTGGLVLPMAIQLGTTVRAWLDPAAPSLRLSSADDAGEAVLDVTAMRSRLAGAEPRNVDQPAGGPPARSHFPGATPEDVDRVAAGPPWARLAGAVALVVGLREGGRAEVSSTLPIGSGLSSSSAFSVALALALGLDPSDPARAAGACQTAEELATGVPVGIMDQLTSLAGRAGQALLLDCGALSWQGVPIPQRAQVIVAHSGQRRTLAGSAYATRRAECEQAAAIVGPLASASPADVATIADPLLRRRARHVVAENARVRAAAEALAAGDLAAAGALMDESHRSLARDYEVSTPALDQLVDMLRAIPGVVGARLTGAGFGGCAVALAGRDDLRPGSVPGRHWLVEATDGARRTVPGE